MKLKTIAALMCGTLPLFLNVTSAQSDAEQKEEAIEEIKVVGTLSRYSATKSDTPILETARSISVEDFDTLLDIGALELADAYTYSAGVAGESFGFSTRGDWLRVRGLDVPQYQDSLQSLFGNYNNTRPEVYTLEQVEILKGPASVLYGQGSPGGIVNTVSKRPQQDAKNEITMSVGSYDYRQFGADLGGKIDQDGRWLYRVVGLTRDTETQVNYVEDNARVLSPSISYVPSEDTNITLLLNYQKSDAVAGAQFLPIAGTLLPAPNGQYIASDFFAGEPGFDRYDGTTKSATILANHQINSTWTMELTARHTKGERDYQQAWVAFSTTPDRYIRNPDGSLYRGGTVPRSFYQSAATSEQSAIDLRFKANFDTGAIEHQLMVGGQYQDVTTDEDYAYAFALGTGVSAFLGDTYWINVFDPQYGNIPSQAILDLFAVDAPESNTKDRGLYLNDQMTLGNWHWNLGVRRDKVSNSSDGYTQDDSATSVATGLLYAFDNGLSPYISYAESFQALIGLDAVTGLPFKPQQGEQVEAGIKYVLPAGRGYVTAAYFDIEQSNLLTSTPIGRTQAGGIDMVSGWEIEAKLNLGQYDVGAFDMEVNLSEIDTETQAGFKFSSVPETQASTWLGFKADNGFKAGLGVRYLGENYGGRDVIETPSVTLVDAMLAYHLEQWTFRLNARNLADEEYQSTCIARGDCFQGERRTLVGSVNYQF